ncbi:unnamed protein product [Musa acuminata subsp. burmannicoides]
MQAVVEEGAMVVESDEEIIITMVGHRDQIGIIMVVIDHNHTEGLCVENTCACQRPNVRFPYLACTNVGFNVLAESCNRKKTHTIGEYS